MAKEKFRIEEGNLIISLTVAHKPLGWFVFLTFGVLGILFVPTFNNLVFGMLGFWSIRRKCEICWSPTNGEWSYRKRNFFKWTEDSYEMSDKDSLSLEHVTSSKMGESTRYSLLLSFIPDTKLKKSHFLSTGVFYLQRFKSPIVVTNVSEPIKKVLEMYSAAGKSLIIELHQIDETSKLRLKNELNLM